MVRRMQSLTYEVVDVFTDRPFAGNPLAVVFGANGLATGQLQALANEFHLSETIFILPPTTPDATYRARIFTTAKELPFAGHPSVGGAVTQMRAGLFGPGTVVQECGAGLLPIVVAGDGSARLAGGTPTIGPDLDPAPLLAAVGLTEADFFGPAPRTAGCGLEFTYLSVRPDALQRVAADAQAAGRHGIEHVSVFAWDPATRSTRTRVFVFDPDASEDPATGSAALGLGVWLVSSDLLPADGGSAYTVRQGIEMGRPSTLECEVTATDGAVASATVAGSVMPIARGTIAVPPGGS
jgi:trans-2,3-dihydro-3-hydroxyanthranilate isomerase